MTGARRGFYSLIQYVPDASRGEGVNVGVALVCDGEVRLRFAETNAGAKQRFQAVNIDETGLAFARREFELWLGDWLKETPTADGLRSAAERTAGEFCLLPPKVARVTDVTSDVGCLYDRLVHVTERHGAHPKQPAMARLVKHLESLNAPFRREKKVELPVTGEKIAVTFSYLNGVRNYVKGVGFSPISFTEQANQLASHALLLNESHQKLVVVGRFTNSTGLNVVQKVLSIADGELIPENEMDDYAHRIARTARSGD